MARLDIPAKDQEFGSVAETMMNERTMHYMRRQKRFETVFRLSQLPSDAIGRKDRLCWRVTGSGVRGRPEDAPWTRAITARLESYGIAIERYCEGTPVNVD